ncbi:MAG: hypothetical protein WCQ95_14675 [Bacteroidota bacterium]
MKKLILLLFAITAFTLSSQSQNETNSATTTTTGQKKCCFKLSSIALDLGSNNYRTMTHHGDKDFDIDKTLMNQPGWQSGNMNLSMNNNSGNTLNRKMLTFQIGLTPWSKKLGDYNKKRELLIGLYYSGSDLENHRSMDYAYTPGDTFSFNTVLYQTDTVSRIGHYNRIEANVLGASVKYLFKTDPEKRVSLFTGVAISAGYAITARQHESYTKDSAVVVSYYTNKPTFEGFDKGSFLGSEEIRSNIKAKSTIFASVYMPFGMNFRLCKTKAIWNQMNLFLEGSVGLQSQIVVKGATHFDPFMGCALGFKFNFN